MRKLLWKIGRRFYMLARGEPLRNLPESSGEIYMQRKMSAALVGVKNPVVLDIGANRGQWTIQFLKTARDAGVDLATLDHNAFEPVPATRDTLTTNIAAAGFADDAQIHPFALSDEIGETHINILGAATSGRNSIVDDPLQIEVPKERILIKTDTIDAFCDRQGIQHLNFVKIDAEGHDYFVMKGGQKMLDDERIDTIQFEYTKRWIDSRRFLKDVFHLIEGRPYHLYRIRPFRLELLDAWHPEIERFFAANYALVHTRAISNFEVLKGSFDKANTYG